MAREFITVSIGDRFDKLTVIGTAGFNGDGRPRYKVRCDCAEELVVSKPDLIRKRSKSCGCARKRNVRRIATTHGLSSTKEYQIYKSARRRCLNHRNKDYPEYGGRGIEFRFVSFPAMMADLGPRPSPKHTLDRIKNDGHYETGNVRWATQVEQANNRRPRKQVTSYVV